MAWCMAKTSICGHWIMLWSLDNYGFYDTLTIHSQLIKLVYTHPVTQGLYHCVIHIISGNWMFHMEDYNSWYPSSGPLKEVCVVYWSCTWMNHYIWIHVGFRFPLKFLASLTVIISALFKVGSTMMQSTRSLHLNFTLISLSMHFFSLLHEPVLIWDPTTDICS